MLLRAASTAWRCPTNAVGHLVAMLAGARTRRRVGGAVVSGWAYELPGGGIGAITLGDVILHDAGFLEGNSGRVLLAHELAHVLQHRVLGPFYLPAHALAQLTSALRSLGHGGGLGYLVHAHNPLEQRWICLGFDECRDLEQWPPEERERVLARYGV